MLQRWQTRLLGVVLVIAFGSTVQADTFSAWNKLNRKLGLGWSDGYHAQNGFAGDCGWATVETLPPAMPQPIQRPRQVEPAPRPVPRAPREARSTPLRAPSGPVLPSQKLSPKPAYWYR